MNEKTFRLRRNEGILWLKMLGFSKVKLMIHRRDAEAQRGRVSADDADYTDGFAETD